MEKNHSYRLGSSFKNRFLNIISGNSRILIFAVIFLFFGFFFSLNWFFLNTLKNQFREVTDREARLYAVAISERLNNIELNWVFKEIVRKTQYPIIITDKYNIPTYWKSIYRGFLFREQNRLLENLSFFQLERWEQDFLKDQVEKLDKLNPPIKLIGEGNVFGYLHYGEIKLISNLAWMPFLELAFLFLFFFAGFFGFQTLRANEQSLIWVALAKETAHQMGTPLSSLMGWLEYLKMKFVDTPPEDRGHEIIQAMENDISRLNKVSIRFSHIGSLPELKEESLNDLVEITIKYFEKRLPQFGKKVTIRAKLDELPKAWINRELIGWVLENLIKNALDSMQSKKHGHIQLETYFSQIENSIHITVSDTGIGIERENWNKVFQTGYSTKKRGWGLGLSLARRIITIYHGGTIFIDWSSHFRGTQFKIILPQVSERVKKRIHVIR